VAGANNSGLSRVEGAGYGEFSSLFLPPLHSKPVTKDRTPAPVPRTPLPSQEQDGRLEGGAMFDAAAAAAAAAGAGAAAAAERASLLLSLEEQARELRSVRAAVTAVRSLMPPARLELWHGLAQLSYSIGLARLTLDLADLDERLAEACRHTASAIQSVLDQSVLDQSVRDQLGRNSVG
jgi:hypothetical protein